MSATLPVMEAFYTVCRAKGLFTGQSAYFIRLGDVMGCTWRDVKDSWDADAHPKFSVEAIVAEAAKFPARIAVITGGSR